MATAERPTRRLIPQLVTLADAQYLQMAPYSAGGYVYTRGQTDLYPTLAPSLVGRPIEMEELLAMMERELASAERLTARFPREDWGAESLRDLVERTRDAMEGGDA